MAAAGEAKWTLSGQWIARCSLRRTLKKTHNLGLGGGLESDDRGDDVIWIGELEEQVPVKGGRIHCGRTYDARSVLIKR